MSTGARGAVLAGDIGGTKTVLALYDWLEDGPHELRHESFASSDFSSFEAVIAEFLRDSLPVQVAAFGVAGPVFDGRCDVTNLPWVLDERAIGGVLGARAVRLLNDLQTTALGMTRLASSEWIELNPWAQAPAVANIGVIAAGTGLGEAVLVWDGERYFPMSTESGHADFAPNSECEDDLLRFMRQRYPDHVSYERLVSGAGLVAIYDFVRQRHCAGSCTSVSLALEHAADPAPLITQGALELNDPLCREALNIFVRIYGAEAGNLALRCMARGGIFVGGGIAPKILPALQQGGFMQSFAAKGRFAEFLGRLPVRVAMNPDASLLGAAYAASLLL